MSKDVAILGVVNLFVLGLGLGPLVAGCQIFIYATSSTGLASRIAVDLLRAGG